VAEGGGAVREEQQRRIAQELSAQLNAMVPEIMAGINARQGSRALAEQMRTDPGTGRSTEWEAEDGWLIGYSTSRISGGKLDGKFLVTAHRPKGKGSRSGRGQASRWELAYARPFSTRKAAKARALQLYRQHSPRWAARHTRKEPEDG
jgi:hypothetical protein